jgi:hypothetical protein
MSRLENTMNTDVLRNFFMWSTIINYGLLMYWFLVFAFAHDRFERILGRVFRFAPEQFDVGNAIGMTIYKLGVIIFNLVPFLVLLIVT